MLVRLVRRKPRRLRASAGHEDWGRAEAWRKKDLSIGGLAWLFVVGCGSLFVVLCIWFELVCLVGWMAIGLLGCCLGVREFQHFCLPVLTITFWGDSN